MKYFKLKNLAAKNIQAGNRLIQLEDFDQPFEVHEALEGMVIGLLDLESNFLGQALVGRQNKGFAWIFSVDSEEYWSVELVTRRLETAIQKRSSLFNSEKTDGFRLFNGEGDGVGGLSIDWYNEYLQLNWYSSGAFAYQEWWLEALTQSKINIKGIYQTKRFEDESLDSPISLIWGQAAPQPLVIKEEGRRYAVYLGQDWMTGIFFDQRSVRNFIQAQAMGASVLNLFSYTGAFSVAAALGGAERTVSVDVANRSLEWTQENLTLNGLVDKLEQHEIRVMNVFNYLDYAFKAEELFDLIVCDPPSFARTKEYTFSAIRDYSNLAVKLARLTKPGGFCLLSTNHSTYSKESFIEQMNQAGKQAGVTWQLIQVFDLGRDFPTSNDLTSNYLKVLVYYRSE